MGIHIEFIGVEMLKGITPEQKIYFILEHVKEDRIVVIDEGLTALEEGKLIQATMLQVNKKFQGIEVSTLREKTADGLRERLIRMLGGSTGGLTVIGPAKLIKQISKDPRMITMLATPEDEEKKSAKK
ncbi:MAG: DUF2073 domain-containing protein [Candidatus Altiarchaeota archaeon]